MKTASNSSNTQPSAFSRPLLYQDRRRQDKKRWTTGEDRAWRGKLVGRHFFTINGFTSVSPTFQTVYRPFVPLQPAPSLHKPLLVHEHIHLSIMPWNAWHTIVGQKRGAGPLPSWHTPGTLRVLPLPTGPCPLPRHASL